MGDVNSASLLQDIGIKPAWLRLKPTCLSRNLPGDERGHVHHLAFVTQYGASAILTMVKQVTTAKNLPLLAPPGLNY